MDVDKPVVHKSVLVDEVLHYLDLKPDGIYVDATLGGGGHTRMILEQEPTCMVIGMDWDKSVIETVGRQLEEEFEGRFIALWGNFSRINMALAKAGHHKVDGVLADFGTSQVQIAKTPGLSFSREAALDMRMSPAHFRVTAYDLLKKCSEKELADMFYVYGQETYSRKIAREIVEKRRKRPLKTTKELAKLIESVVPFKKNRKIHPATKVFQALRIVVNKELDNISAFLTNSMKVLSPEGRLVCISFHSLEDRLVKQFFKEQKKQTHGKFEILTPKVCIAQEEELERNKSARSAKLRAGKLQN